MPRRAIAAIEKSMALTLSRIEFGAVSGADQVPRKIASLLLKGIVRTEEQDGRRTACHYLPIGNECADRPFRGPRLLRRHATAVREAKSGVDQDQRVGFARDGNVLVIWFECV